VNLSLWVEFSRSTFIFIEYLKCIPTLMLSNYIGRDCSTVDGRSKRNAIGPECHVIAEGYRLVM